MTSADRTPHKRSILDHSLHPTWGIPLIVGLMLLPAILTGLEADYYISVASRMLIFALIACSLNLILGFGGMISLGHAAYVGVGAYTVGILMVNGVASAWLAWPAAFVMGGVFACLIGAICLYTRGVYFIMITLAFAQMMFYLMVSFKQFGGEDGLNLPARSSVGMGIDLFQDTHFYFVVLLVFILAFVALARLLNARFGHVLQGIRENEARMQALGYPVYRYKLVAFTLAGALAGLGGALLANQAIFVSPALMTWEQSGVLLIMVILGGVGYLYGGLVGAFTFLLIEEILVPYTIYWQFYVGAILLLVVLMTPNGILSLRRKRSPA